MHYNAHREDVPTSTCTGMDVDAQDNHIGDEEFETMSIENDRELELQAQKMVCSSCCTVGLIGFRD